MTTLKRNKKIGLRPARSLSLMKTPAKSSTKEGAISILLTLKYLMATVVNLKGPLVYIKCSLRFLPRQKLLLEDLSLQMVKNV